jgi:hypothetical protein
MAGLVPAIWRGTVLVAMAGTRPMRIRISAGGSNILPLPLREGAGGRGGTSTGRGRGITRQVRLRGAFPLPPTPSRKWRGRTFLRRGPYPDAHGDKPGHDGERAEQDARSGSLPSAPCSKILTVQFGQVSLGLADGPVRAPLRRRAVCRHRPASWRYPIAFCRLSSSFARKSCVFSHFWSGPISTARSRVMSPDSTVPMQTFSSASANRVTSGVSSNRPR